MGFFYISAPYLQKSKEATHRQINDVVLKKSIADGKEIFLDRKKFKLSNLDTLMMVNDKLLKLQTGIESFLKKVDRQFLDLQEKQSHQWYIKSLDKQYTVPKYLYNFNWNDSKYPRTYPLLRIAETIEAKLANFETQIRTRNNAYNETKTQLSQNTIKEGNYFIRDLTDVLIEPNISPEDFVYTKFITTLIVIVPNVLCDTFLRQYATITDYVVPGSAKKLNVPEKDNLTIWKVNIFNERLNELERKKDQQQQQENQGRKKVVHSDRRKNLTPVQQFIERARERMKVVAKQFKFQSGFADQKKKKKKDLEIKLASQNKAVSDMCLAYFAEGYQLYIHAKFLRLIVQTNMRFGSDPTVIYVVQTVSGKEKNVLSLLVEIFGDKQSEGLYGTKDQIDDGEDFFPFIYIPTMTI